MNEEQLTKAVEQLSVQMTANKKAIAGITDTCQEVLRACKSLLVESKKAQDIALHAFKIDECGWVWRWDPDAHTYVKTDCRINKPVKRGEDDIADGAITTPKLADFAVTEQKLDPDVVNQIHSAGEHGYALSNEFGNDPLIGISQKTLTEAFNKVWAKIDELSGEVSNDLEMTVTPEYYIGEDGCNVHFNANSEGLSGIFEHIKFLADGVVVAEADNVATFEGSTTINDTTVIRCEAQVMGELHTKEKTVRHFSSFYLGAGTQYSDVMDVEHLINIDGGVGGRYEVTCEEGDRIYIVMGEAFRPSFERADMNGFEIPFNESTETVDGKVYVVFESVNTYTAGTYEININA